MTEDYISPNQDPEYWRKHINGMLLEQYSDDISGWVLNVGCNHGAESILIAENPRVEMVTAIDINAQAIAIAKHRRKKIDFRVMDICSLALLPIYNTIICFHTLEHVLDIEKTAKNITFLAKGSLIVSVPYKDAYASEYHVREFTTASLEKLFKPAFLTKEVYRDRRIDGHGNKHDCITYIGHKVL